MISFITPTQGNPIALKRTIDSVAHICDEFIIGDVCPFEEDSQLIRSYPGVKTIKLPVNYIFHYGFSQTLNELAEHAKNDLVLYLNVGEVLSESGDVLAQLSSDYNAYYIDHATETHRWWRFYNKNELRWGGLIHEELVGEYRPYHKPIFRFADTEKDQNNPFKAKVYNDIKEMTYWNQLIKIADNPDISPVTNAGWVKFARETYKSMKDRLSDKGNRYEAFVRGNIEGYLRMCEYDPVFEWQQFQTNDAIEFQGEGQKKYLL